MNNSSSPHDSGNFSDSGQFKRQPDEDTSLLAPGDHVPYNLGMSKSQILWNLLIKSVSFLFLFTSFQALSNLQSVLNVDSDVGHGGLAVIYGCIIFSTLFLPSFVISHIGYKWTIVFSMMCYILYMAANYEPIWPLIAPSAAILGIGAGPLWTAQCSYLTRLAIGYSNWTRQNENDVIHYFCGIFFFVFQISEIAGNMISSGVLKKKSTKAKSEHPLDECGTNFDPNVALNSTAFDKPDSGKVYELFGIYIALALLAYLFVATCLDSIPGERQARDIRRNGLQSLLHTFKHWITYPNQLFLLLLTVYSGIEQSFLIQVYTKAFISCILGISDVGYVLACYGAVDSVCSLVFSRLVPRFGTVVFYLLALMAHGSTLIVLIIKPLEEPYLLYIFAALWGLGDSVIKTQTNAMYGCLYKENPVPAFANYRLLESIGFLIMFVIADLVQTYMKMYITLGFLVCGILGYIVFEMKLAWDRRRNA